MKRTALIIALVISLASCKNNKKADATTVAKEAESSTTAPSEQQKADTTLLTDTLDWSAVPELKNIGNYPFFKAPEGLQIENAKDGLSEVFDYEKMQNYLGKGTYTTEGKLGLMNFAGAGDKDFNQKWFDKNIFEDIAKMGAKELYKGKFPEDEASRQKLRENMWNGKHRTMGLGDDEPFAVYAFKNNGKKYIFNIQSNSAQGSIFLMELKP